MELRLEDERKTAMEVILQLKEYLSRMCGSSEDLLELVLSVDDSMECFLCDESFEDIVFSFSPRNKSQLICQYITEVFSLVYVKILGDSQ